MVYDFDSEISRDVEERYVGFHIILLRWGFGRSPASEWRVRVTLRETSQALWEMNMKMIRKAVLLAAASVAASALIPASASAETFNFLGSNSNTSNTYGNVRTFTGNEGTKLEVSAYSLSEVNALTKAFVGQYVGGGTKWGLGVTNSGNDNSHTIDNSGWTDFVVLQFDKIMTVSDLGIYGFGDTDLSWAVATTSTPFSGVLNLSNLSIFGTLNVSNGPNSTTLQNRAVNGAAKSGNLFIVGASNAKNDSNDSFKLNNLIATSAVPEPATWGMMIGGFALAGVAMRRRKTAVSFA